MQDEGAENSGDAPANSDDPAEKPVSEHKESCTKKKVSDAEHAGESPTPSFQPMGSSQEELLNFQAMGSSHVVATGSINTANACDGQQTTGTCTWQVTDSSVSAVGNHRTLGLPAQLHSPTASTRPSGMCLETADSLASRKDALSPPQQLTDLNFGRTRSGPAPSVSPPAQPILSSSSATSFARPFVLTAEFADQLSSHIADAVSRRLIREIRSLLAAHQGHHTSHAMEGGAPVYKSEQSDNVDTTPSSRTTSLRPTKSISAAIGQKSIKGHLRRCSPHARMKRSPTQASELSETTSTSSPNNDKRRSNRLSGHSSARLGTESSELSNLSQHLAVPEPPERRQQRSSSAPPDQEVAKAAALYGQRNSLPQLPQAAMGFSPLEYELVSSPAQQEEVKRTSRLSKLSGGLGLEQGSLGARTDYAVKDLESSIADALIADALPSASSFRRYSAKTDIRSSTHSHASKSPSSCSRKQSGVSSLLTSPPNLSSTEAADPNFLQIPNDNRSVGTSSVSRESSTKKSEASSAQQAPRRMSWLTPFTQVRMAIGTSLSRVSERLDERSSMGRTGSGGRPSSRSGGMLSFLRTLSSNSKVAADDRQSGLNEIRASTINGILETNHADNDSLGSSVDFDELVEESERMQPRFLQVFGLYPWYISTRRSRAALCMSPSTWYQWIALLLALLASAGCMEQIITTRSQEFVGTMCYKRACLRMGLLSDISLSLGGISGMLALSTHIQSYFFVECRGLLLAYAVRHGFEDRLANAVRWDLAASLTVLALAVIERIRTCRVLHAAMDSELDWWGILQTLAFFFYSSILLGLTFAVLQFCRTMMIMIDSFCYDVASKPCLDGAVHEWNVLQAILRRSSDAVQRCFFVLQTTALCFVFSGVTDVVLLRRSEPYAGDGGEFSTIIQTLIPGLLVTAGVARIFFCAAAVTDKCAHVPSLINSLTYNEEIDHIRQYVVDYIIHSAAGFYVFEVRLTSALALKFMYFSGAAAFTVAATVMTDI